jgi:hypothetical protein
LDFSIAGVGATPIVHVRVASVFTELAPDEVQLIPVDLKGHPDQYLILVATKLIRCIDDTASREVLYWKPEDDRPDKLGQYRSVAGMRIDRTRWAAPPYSAPGAGMSPSSFPRTSRWRWSA